MNPVEIALAEKLIKQRQEATKRYYEKHKEKINARGKEFYLKHQDEILKRQKEKEDAKQKIKQRYRATLEDEIKAVIGKLEDRIKDLESTQ